MLAKIKDTVESMIEPGDKIVVAISGGADSVALLHALYKTSKELNISELSACHMNHNLRGGESLRDENFVRDLCNRLDIPLTVKSTDILSQRQKHQSVEECARAARYTFFEEVSHGRKIATAHTANDNTETVLLNLIRGSTLKGLCGIPPVRQNIIRPLIACTRDLIEQYCSANKLEFITDSSNLSDEYTRNYLRHNVIPLLEQLNPSLSDGIFRMTARLRIDDIFLSEMACNALFEAEDDNKYRVDIIKAAPPPVFSRIISQILSKNNISPSSLMIQGIEDIIKNGKGKINIKKNIFAVVKKNYFYLENIHQNYRN